MKTFGSQAVSLAIAVVTTMMMTSRVEGRSAMMCPPFFELAENNQCAPIALIRNALQDTRREKRQAVAAPCPYCASNVWDIFPNWDDCKEFYYCLNGTVIPIKCTEMGHLYYNPTTKYCENVISPTNSCLFRSFNLLSYVPAVSG